MELVIKLLTILGLGAIELWAAIPAGLALQLHPVSVGITAAIGAMLGALVVVLFGERVRTWLAQRHGRKEEKGRRGLIYRIWRRYGVIGLGLLAPLLTGAPLGAALGLTLGVPAGRLLFWISLGTILWSTGLTLAGALGLAGIETLGH
ncbi:MAG: small multi-drug export protein [Chloroflexi bacterium]|nr:small multi-drug export protein [Chloroflexota bacterium]